MRIGSLAQRTGATRKALRYYQRLGVLTPVRGDNGYREFREAGKCATSSSARVEHAALRAAAERQEEEQAP